MPRVLAVEDDIICQSLIACALEGQGIQLSMATTLSEAKNLLNGSLPYDLVLLDLVLPDGEGITFLEFMQKTEQFRLIPVVLFTVKSDLDTKLAAFGLGADDYLTKPINPLELRARVDLRIRKCELRRREMDLLTLGGLAINLPLMQAYQIVNSTQVPIDLTSKEFKILTILGKNTGRIFSRSELIRLVWGTKTHVVERTVDSHVCGLRKKLGSYSHYVENVIGEGYRLVVLG